MTSYKPIHYLDGSFKTQAGLKSSHGHAPSTHRPIDQDQGSKERRLRHHEKSTLGKTKAKYFALSLYLSSSVSGLIFKDLHLDEGLV